jgi:diguanylate cyclase (GGDEF)-like protein
MILRKEKVRLTVSVGVAGFPRDAQTPEDLIRAADEALFAAKNGGRDRVCSF